MTPNYLAMQIWKDFHKYTKKYLIIINSRMYYGAHCYPIDGCIVSKTLLMRIQQTLTPSAASTASKR